MASTTVTAGVRFKNILVPLDFSPRCNAAARLAQAIAQRHGAVVHLANVIEEFGTAGMSSRVRRKEEQERALSDFAAIESRYFSQVDHQKVLLDGDVSGSLVRAARDRQIDLVVIASHGLEGCERLLFGSISEELFRTVQCPVLSVGPQVGDHYDRFASFHDVLYPMEITPSSIAAVPYVVGLLYGCGSNVTLLHVVHPDVQSPSERERVRVRLASEMKTLFPRMVRPSLKDIIVEFGGIPETVVEFALARRSDVIVLGVRKAGAFTRGATHVPWAIAHRIIANAPCPVLSVCDGNGQME